MPLVERPEEPAQREAGDQRRGEPGARFRRAARRHRGVAVTPPTQVAAQFGEQAALDPPRRQREPGEPQRELAQRLRQRPLPAPQREPQGQHGRRRDQHRHRGPHRDRRTAARPAAAAGRRRCRTASRHAVQPSRPRHEPPRAAEQRARDRQHRERRPEHRRLDRLRPRLAARAVEREPAVADLLQRGRDRQPAEQHDRAAPLVAEHEHDQVRAEQRQADAERERPHQRQPVGLLEQLLEHVAALPHAHDRRDRSSWPGSGRRGRRSA